MQVAFFTDSYAPTHDGVAQVTAALARELDRQGVGVRVFAPNPVRGAPPRDELLDGIEVVRCRSLPVPYYGQYQWGLFPFGQLRGRELDRSVDVIHLHSAGIMGSAAFFAARRYRKPLVGTFHTNISAMRESFPDNVWVRLFFRVAWWYTLGTYWRCDVATAPTWEAAATLEAAARKPFARPVAVIPNGIPVDRFRPGIDVPDWRSRCGLPDVPLVVYLGRLTEDKGIHRFLDAVEELAAERAVGALVAGVGPEAPAVRARLRREPLARCSRYVGPLAEEEKPSFLAQADVVVLPSTSDTSSVTALEAMASGVPCIVSDRGGLPDVVRDGETGRVVPLDVPGALPRAIGELLDDPVTRRRLGTQGREWVLASASIGAMARRFISLYELLLTEGASRDGGGARRARAARAAGPAGG